GRGLVGVGRRQRRRALGQRPPRQVAVEPDGVTDVGRVLQRRPHTFLRPLAKDGVAVLAGEKPSERGPVAAAERPQLLGGLRRRDLGVDEPALLTPLLRCEHRLELAHGRPYAFSSSRAFTTLSTRWEGSRS